MLFCFFHFFSSGCTYPWVQNTEAANRARVFSSCFTSSEPVQSQENPAKSVQSSLATWQPFRPPDYLQPGDLIRIVPSSRGKERNCAGENPAIASTTMPTNKGNTMAGNYLLNESKTFIS